jgi:hypothetical protein
MVSNLKEIKIKMKHLTELQFEDYFVNIFNLHKYEYRIEQLNQVTIVFILRYIFTRFSRKGAI